MERPTFLFRQAQSAFDLISLLKASDDEDLSRLGGQGLIKTVRDGGCRFESRAEEACYQAVALAVLDAQRDADLAVAVLVANALQSGLWCSDIREFCEAAEEQIKRAPRRLRTAILRGLDALDEYNSSGEPKHSLLPDESRLTREKEQIVPLLCDLARQMDRATRASVAAADYGYEADVHARVLDEVLERDDCKFTGDEFWNHPGEVVQLVAHVRTTPGFVCCTALLLANAIPTNDAKDWFGFRWENIGRDYNALPDSSRALILAGLRYLYEAECLCVTTPEPSEAFWDPVEMSSYMIQYEALDGE